MLVGSAHIVAGDASLIPRVLALLEMEGLPVVANPDIYVREYALLGVDEAREIRERAALKGRLGQRVFVLAAPSVTSEAQNALLKTLEEAPGDALFFLIVPAPNTLLPTVRSRVQPLSLPYEGKNVDTGVDAREFLATVHAKRLDMLKPLLEKGDDERRDIGAVLAFLTSLERTLGESPGPLRSEGLGAVYRARMYASDKGALIKPLPEQVALLVPVVK